MFLKDIFKKNRTLRNEKYNRKLRESIRFEKTPTIISNNCIGGVIYHNLGLKFMSPCVNLYFENEDFLLFTRHLKVFADAELIEVKSKTKDFPVGKLSTVHGEVYVFFQHYRTFEEAKKKWEERLERVNWDDIVIIMEEGKDTSDAIAEKFQEIPWDKKVLLCNGNVGHISVKNGFPIYIYDDKYHPGKILDFGRFNISNKRYLDEFDYVEFLNTGDIRRKRG